MVAFLGALLFVAMIAGVVAKISGTLALIVTAAWLIGFENAHQYVAPLWWTCGISTVVALIGVIVAAVLSEK